MDARQGGQQLPAMPSPPPYLALRPTSPAQRAGRGPGMPPPWRRHPRPRRPALASSGRSRSCRPSAAAPAAGSPGGGASAAAGPGCSRCCLLLRRRPGSRPTTAPPCGRRSWRRRGPASLGTAARAAPSARAEGWSPAVAVGSRSWDQELRLGTCSGLARAPPLKRVSFFPLPHLDGIAAREGVLAACAGEDHLQATRHRVCRQRGEAVLSGLLVQDAAAAAEGDAAGGEHRKRGRLLAADVHAGLRRVVGVPPRVGGRDGEHKPRRRRQRHRRRELRNGAALGVARPRHEAAALGTPALLQSRVEALAGRVVGRRRCKVGARRTEGPRARGPLQANACHNGSVTAGALALAAGEKRWAVPCIRSSPMRRGHHQAVCMRGVHPTARSLPGALTCVFRS